MPQSDIYATFPIIETYYPKLKSGLYRCSGAEMEPGGAGRKEGVVVHSIIVLRVGAVSLTLILIEYGTHTRDICICICSQHGCDN